MDRPSPQGPGSPQNEGASKTREPGFDLHPIPLSSLLQNPDCDIDPNAESDKVANWRGSCDRARLFSLEPTFLLFKQPVYFSDKGEEFRGVLLNRS